MSAPLRRLLITSCKEERERETERERREREREKHDVEYLLHDYDEKMHTKPPIPIPSQELRRERPLHWAYLPREMARANATRLLLSRGDTGVSVIKKQAANQHAVRSAKKRLGCCSAGGRSQPLIERLVIIQGLAQHVVLQVLAFHGDFEASAGACDLILIVREVPG